MLSHKSEIFWSFELSFINIWNAFLGITKRKKFTSNYRIINSYIAIFFQYITFFYYLNLF